MKKTRIILDSGAFSAWMKKLTISIKDYGEFAMSNYNSIDYIVNLDVIPGSFGNKRLSEEVLEKSANEGWKNLEYLINLNIPQKKLIHVFHQGENFKHLERMNSDLDYIGISPANDRTTKEKTKWLDECMKYVTHKGEPTVKFHGFAVTSLPLIYRYPWYSVDSTSWVTFGKYGAILYPRTTRGQYDYKKPPYVIFVSDKSTKKDIKGKHYDTFSSIEKETINEYLKSIGTSKELVSVNNLERDRANMIFYIQLENHLKGKNDVKIYFAGNFPMLSKMERELFTRDRAFRFTETYRRLCSFYYKNYALKMFTLKRSILNESKRIVRRIIKRKTRSGF